MAFGRLRGSGVRALTYVDDVLQSDPLAPGLGAVVSLFDIYFLGQKNYIKNLIGFGISHTVGS